MLDSSKGIALEHWHAPVGGSSCAAEGDQHSLPTVVLVDDNADNLELLSFILEQFECLQFCVAEGQAALKLIMELKPSLVLLDVLLPGLSGFEIVEAVRAHKLTSHIPIIAVTAMAGTHERERILSAGFNQYISKPFLFDEIKVLVNSYLNPLRKLS